MGGLEGSQTVGSRASSVASDPRWPEVHRAALKIRAASLGVLALLLHGLQLGDQGIGLVGAGDRLRQPDLGGGELRDLDEEMVALGAPLLTRLDVVGGLAEV